MPSKSMTFFMISCIFLLLMTICINDFAIQWTSSIGSKFANFAGKTPKRHFVVFVTENFRTNNHLQIDTIKCYNKEKDYQFHLFNLNKTEKCNQTVEFYRRHCLLAETMHSDWEENDFAYLMDSDVIAHNYEGEWDFEQEKKYDLIFYERWFNGEVVAGGYGVKNTAKTREFLHKWANLEYGQPKGFSSADNGAIHVALMAWFKGAENSKAMECMDQYNNLEANVTNLVPYNDFVNCARIALGMGEWLEAYRDADDEMLRKFRAEGIELNKNGISLKLVPRFQGFMVDYMVAERSKSAIFWHGVKNSDVLQKHWKVQEDNTTYPKCQPIENFKVIFKTTTPYVKKTESTKLNRNQTTGDLVQELKEDLSHLGEDVSHLASKMDDFKKSSFKIQHALDITDQEKGRLSILEKLQIYENETIINIKQLKTEMMNSIENSSSDISAELKLLKESTSLTANSVKEVQENQQKIINWLANKRQRNKIDPKEPKYITQSHTPYAKIAVKTNDINGKDVINTGDIDMKVENKIL